MFGAGTSRSSFCRLLSWHQIDPFRLAQIPPQLQSLLFQHLEASFLLAVTDEREEAADFAMVLSACHARGFGCPRDAARSHGYRLQAARMGHDLAPVTVLTDGLLDGFDSSVTPEEKMAWLKAATCAAFFPRGQGRVRAEAKEAFQSGLDSIPAELAEPSLWYAIIKLFMESRIVHHLAFDGAADDPLFSLAINGDKEGLAASLKADPRLLQRRKEGFTLLHVAADYSQEGIIAGSFSSTHFEGNALLINSNTHVRISPEFYSVS